MLCVLNRVKLELSLLPPYGSNHICTMVDSLKTKRISRFPRKGHCVAKILISKSSNISRSKKSNLEHHSVGGFPKQQFAKRAYASLLSANLISLLYYTILKIKKKTDQHIYYVMNGSLRLWSLTPVLSSSPKGRPIRSTFFFLL